MNKDPNNKEKILNYKRGMMGREISTLIVANGCGSIPLGKGGGESTTISDTLKAYLEMATYEPVVAANVFVLIPHGKRKKYKIKRITEKKKNALTLKNSR